MQGSTGTTLFRLAWLKGLDKHSQKILVVLSVVPIAFYASDLCAQVNQTGNIHGAVIDPSGAAIAGVTITLTSPAILAPLTTTSDSGGNYRFEQLPVGIYEVSASQAGFAKYVRQNIQISAGFSAEVNLQMSVGSSTESVTVSAAGPVVDTTSTTVGASVGASAIANELPVTRTMPEMVAIAPGVMPTTAPDLGGGVVASFTLSAYGITGEATTLIEGINTRKSATNSESNFDYTTLEEMQIVPTGGDAQTALPGVFLNAIVKSGGNTFHGRGEVNIENQKLEANNLNALLRSQGNTAPQLILDAVDSSVNLGGPIIKDKWWFFGGAHVNNSHRTALGYLIDGKPASNYARFTNETAKTTYQLSPNYKLIGFWTQETQYFPDRFGSATVPQLNTRLFTENVRDWKGEIQGSPNGRLVFDLFAGHHMYQANYYAHQDDPQNIPSYQDITTGMFNGPNVGQDRRGRHQTQVTGTLSYFPAGSFLGHHEIKVGSTWMFMWTGTDEPNGVHGNYQLIFQTIGGVAGQPSQIQFFNYPLPDNRENLNEGGGFVMDTWKVAKRFTINLGLRIDDMFTWVPAQTHPAGAFGPPWVAPASGNPFLYTGAAQSFPRLSTGSWNTLAPRIGMVWDVIGNGKNVLKASYGKYVWTPGDDFAAPFNSNGVTISTYKWTNTTCTETVAAAGGCDYVPGSIDLNPNGPNFQSLLGGSNGSTAKLANSVLNPNLKQQYSNEYQVFFEREVAPGVAARLGYTYIQNANTWLQIPTQIPFNAWNIPYTVHDLGPTVAPCLPTATVSCPTTGPSFTIYDMNAAYKGQAFTQTEYVNRGSANADHFSTIEATLTKRGGSGKWTAIISYTATRNHQWIIPAAGINGNQAASPIATNPNQLLFPMNTTWVWQARVTGNYKLPWRFDISSTFQIYNGLLGQRTETYTLPNAGAVTVPVGAYGSFEGPLRPLLNFRLARDFKTEKHGTFRPNIEFLNALNSAAPWAITLTSGPRFGYYTTTDTPFIVRAGVIYNF